MFYITLFAICVSFFEMLIAKKKRGLLNFGLQILLLLVIVLHLGIRHAYYFQDTPWASFYYAKIQSPLMGTKRDEFFFAEKDPLFVSDQYLELPIPAKAAVERAKEDISMSKYAGRQHVIYIFDDYSYETLRAPPKWGDPSKFPTQQLYLKGLRECIAYTDQFYSRMEELEGENGIIYSEYYPYSW